ncbi:hypothetical protein EON65_28980 [archaeon]|nr:MAG: hypothetical protein EON65_28980 [archaeon]
MIFVESFMARFIDIASADIEPSVSASMLETLLVMQEKGFLDSVAADMLDKVDQVVFDSTADVHVRRGALRFMMAHTEGFDDFDEDKHIAALQSSKKKADNIKQHMLIARRKNTALQLETLTEFAEYHLGSHVEHSWLLAEACLGTEKDRKLCVSVDYCCLFLTTVCIEFVILFKILYPLRYFNL